jgi:hypothetical protein
MSTQRSHHRSRHWMATRQAGARLGRLATVLAAVTTGLLLASAAATAAFANPIPIGDGSSVPITPVPPATVRVISACGMAGWQFALIAAGAALAPWPPPCPRTASWPAAAALPLPPPDAPTRNRTPRLSDDRPPGLDRQAGLHLPSSRSGKS